MTLNVSKALKPLRKLRKLLKGVPADPRPEQVHSMRTQSRRVEAVVDALLSSQDPKAKDLIGLIAPVRKAAGKVRDMDVLMADVLTLPKGENQESRLRLLEHLAKMRARSSRRLSKVAGQMQTKTRRTLKRCTRQLEGTLDGSGNGWQPAAGPEILATELAHWPRLTAQNLHLFRIRVKELAYMLEMGENAPRTRIAELKRVKDAAGEWHDWVELTRISQKVLDPKLDKSLLSEIANTKSRKLTQALAASNTLRKHGFDRLAGSKAKPE